MVPQIGGLGCVRFGPESPWVPPFKLCRSLVNSAPRCVPAGVSAQLGAGMRFSRWGLASSCSGVSSSDLAGKLAVLQAGSPPFRFAVLPLMRTSCGKWGQMAGKKGPGLKGQHWVRKAD